MKILYLVYNFSLAPQDGMQRNSLNFYHYLYRKFDSVNVLSFSKTPMLNDNISIFESKDNSIYSTFKISVFLFLNRCFIFFLKKNIKHNSINHIDSSLLENYQVIHAEGIAMLFFLPLLRSKKIIFSLLDSPSLRHSRSKNFVKWVFGHAVEFFATRFAKKIHFVSNIDAAYFQKKFPNTSTIVIPVSIEKEIYGYEGQDTNDMNKALIWGDFNNKFISDGVINIISSSIKNQFNLFYLGKDSKKLLNTQMARNLEIIDWVESINSKICEFNVIIVPDQGGSGIKNRVIHAMGLGRLVVGTQFAFEGIEVEHGIHCFFYESVSELHDLLFFISKNHEMVKKLQKKARDFVIQRYSVESVERHWDTVYKEFGGS